MKNIACSKFWTDLNIRGHLQQITHCCKRTYFNVSIDDLNKYKSNIFNNHPLILDERKRMIESNQLTENCKSCIDYWPNSHWHSLNKWQDKNWFEQDLENLKTSDLINKIEISLSNKCNFSCMYCGSDYSSSWGKLLAENVKITNTEWIDAVIKYLKLYIQKDKTYKIGFIGGEPLLDLEVLNNVETFIEHLNSNSNNEIYILTSLGVKEKTLQKFLNLTKKYKNIKWRISVSIDSFQENGEIIRDGLNFNIFFKNLNLIIKENSIKHLTLLPTINALNISTLQSTVERMLKIEKEVDNSSNISFSIGCNSVIDPIAMNPAILPESYKIYIDNALFLLGNEHYEFKRHLTIIKNIIGKERSEKTLKLAKNWYNVQGRLKNKNYFKLFPDLDHILNVDNKK